MPYILRNAQGEITSLHREAVPGAQAVPADDAELRGFVAGLRAAQPTSAGRSGAPTHTGNPTGQRGPAAAPPFDSAEALREQGQRLDDLIDLLVARNLIRITDLRRRHADEPGRQAATLDLGLRADDVLPAALAAPTIRHDHRTADGSDGRAGRPTGAGQGARAMPVGLRARSPATELDSHTALGALGILDGADAGDDSSVL
jgi:hypothetical protein